MIKAVKQGGGAVSRETRDTQRKREGSLPACANGFLVSGFPANWFLETCLIQTVLESCFLRISGFDPVSRIPYGT